MAKVNHRISNLTVRREGYDIKADWRVPPEMLDSSDQHHATWIDIYMDFASTKRSQDKRKGVGMSDGSTPPLTYIHSDKFWIRGQNTGETVTKNFDRTRWHPCIWKGVDGDQSVSQVGNYCANVTVGVFGGNGNSIQNAGITVWATYPFYKPRAPKVKWDYSAGDATVTVETDPGDDNHERYDTMVRITIKTMGGTKFVTLDQNLKGWFSTKATKWTKTFDISSYIGGLVAGKCVTVKCEAYARGMAGDSTPVEVTRTVALPTAATIGAVTVDKKATGGRVMVKVTPKGYTNQVQLQRRHGTSGSWTAVSGAVDDGQCTALYDSYADANPTPGEYIYYRVVSSRDGYTSPSAAKRADCLYTKLDKPTCDAKIGITAISPGSSGTSATVVMAWTDGKTTSTGCELSYATDYRAWSNTDSTLVTRVEDEGTDSTKASSASAYGKSRTVTVSSLTAGTKYYARMRRYRTVSGTKYYTAYTDLKSFTTESAANDKCGFIEIEPGADGTTAKLLIGINENSDNLGTEVTWSDHTDAWWSNEQPEILKATWAATTYSGAGWTKCQTVYLRKLTPGTDYTVKARRYDATSFGSYGRGSFRTLAQSETLDLRCGIVSLTAGADGRSAVAVVGWSGDRDGCELSWSDDPDAWESSEQPKPAEFGWADASSQSAAWASTGTFHITGLDEGATCYVRARSFADAGGKVYSPYSEMSNVTPIAAPDSVTLTAPEAVARGEAIELWWTVQSDMEQREWHVHQSGSANKSLVEGTGTLCRATIPPERYGDAASITVYVEAGCGGGLTASANATVAIADAPPCDAYMASTLTSQPASFMVYTDASASKLLCTCRSRGVTLDAPDGAHDQLEGDVVWTEAVTPSLTETTWGATDLYGALSDAADAAQDAADEAEAALAELEEGDDGYEDALVAYGDAEAALEAAEAALAAHPSSGTTYEATVDMPVCELLDGGSYVIQVSAVESIAGLASGTVEVPFEVEYAHQAPAPTATLTPSASGRTVSIAMASPTGAADGDVYDVYRRTPTGYELAAGGCDLSETIVDQFAPFGSGAYRIATRTPDGDICWKEFAYSLPVKVLRFDWDGKHVELPFNIQLRDRYAKSFEARAHADGSVGGYYDKVVSMTGSYASCTAKVADPDAVKMLRELGDYPGACFCRTPEGDAFQCNCDVSELGTTVASYSEVALDVTRVRLTGEFRADDERGGASNG